MNGTQKSRTALDSEVNYDFPDNTTGEITPAITRQAINDLIASSFNLTDTKIFQPENVVGFIASNPTTHQAAIQACVTAAVAVGGTVLLAGTYYLSSTIYGTGNCVIDGLDTGIVYATFTSGDIFNFVPSGTVVPTVVSTGITRLTFKNLWIDATVQMSSGNAIYVAWSDSTRIDNVRIGTPTLNVPGTQFNIYTAIFLDKQSNCSINHPRFYASYKGFITTGGTTQATAWFSFGGWIGGGGFCYGNYATSSIGIHIAGGNGGFEIGDFDCGQWGNIGLLCDMSLYASTNHELFVGRAFFDSCGVCGIYIASGALYILKLHNSWAAGNGRLSGLAIGAGQPPQNGCGLYVQKTNGSLNINVTSGTHMYANNGIGMLIEDCFTFVMVGAQIRQNGVNNVSGYNHNLEMRGGNNALVAWNDFTVASGSPFVIRATNSGAGYLGVQSYDFGHNDGGGCGANPIEENVNSRTGNMYVGKTMGPDNINFGGDAFLNQIQAGMTVNIFSVPTTTFTNIPGLTYTMPINGSYLFFVQLRYNIQVSSGEGFFTAQLAQNGTAIANTAVLITDSAIAGGANVKGTASFTLPGFNLSANDVITVQIFKVSGPTYVTAELDNDSNGMTLFTAHLLH